MWIRNSFQNASKAFWKERPCEWNSLGAKARKRAETFSWDRVGRDHLSLIGDLKEKRNQVAPPLPLSVHFTQRQDQSGDLCGLVVLRELVGKEGNANGVLDKCRKMEGMFTAP
jgi:hypothetical protein